MKQETEKLIIKATGALKLRDLLLRAGTFDRVLDSENTDEIEALQQSKRDVSYKVFKATITDATVEIFEVSVFLGVRLVKTAEANDHEDNPKALALIEAEFVVDYEMTSSIPDDALKAFANFNAVHNVWPFWRQHVFDLCQRGRLPQLDIPLYAGMSAGQVE